MNLIWWESRCHKHSHYLEDFHRDGTFENYLDLALNVDVGIQPSFSEDDNVVLVEHGNQDF